ncbi:MAG: hypothetical protein DSY76_06845 [Bacteroidetes bacterium]|nr:MAG: hypothetical protein DSY76_06845 [Bacteroidota bacterium]
MTEKIEMKVKNLELLLKLKSKILKANNIDDLINQVCVGITEFEAYDVSWSVLVDAEGNQIAQYSSFKGDDKDLKPSCWKEVLKTNDLYIKARNSAICKQCSLSSNDESIMISKKIEYQGSVFGVFAVSIKKHLLDQDLKNQFSDLVSDLSVAIYSLNLKKENEIYQSELAESRNMYRTLLNTSNTSLGIMNLDFEIVYMSKSLKALFGFSEDDDSIIKKGVKGFDFLAESFKEPAPTRIIELLESGEGKTDVVFNTINGEQKHVRMNLSYMHNADGEKSGYMIVFHDLSAEKKTAEDLRISEEKFRLLFLKAPHGVSLLSPKGYILDCNERDAEMLKYSREELIGTHIQDYLDEKGKEQFRGNFEEFKKSGSKNIVVNLVRKDGQIIIVERSVSALKHSDGNLMGVVVHSRDITQWQQAQQQIKVLLAAIEQSSSSFTITDINGNITYVNKRFTELTGYSREEVMGQNPRFLKSGKLSNEVYSDMWDKLKNNKTWKGEICNKRKDGGLYWEYASMSAIRNSKGEITNLLKVAEDITQRRIADQCLKETTVRYHNIFNLVPIPIIIHINGKIVDANEAAISFSKVKDSSSLLGMDVMHFVHDSSKEMIQQRMAALMNGEGMVYPTNALYLDIEGGVHNVRSVSKEVSFKGERAFMVVFEDVTEFKQAQRKIQESERKFRDIFNLHPDPISIADLDTGILYEANEALLGYLGVKREEVVGISSYQTGMYKDVNVRKKIVDIVKTEGKVSNYEVQFNTKDKSITALVSGSRFGGDDSNKVLFVARDISAIKEAEQKLIESEKRFRQFFSLIPDPVIITNMKTQRFVELNDAAIKITGRTYDELVGMGIMEYGLFKNVDERDSLVELIKNKKGILNEELELNINGTTYTMLVSASIIEPFEEQNVLWIGRDISSRKLMEQDLIEAKEKAEEGEQLKAMFLSNMSHEIRTPLNAILGFSDLLRDTEIHHEHRNQYIDIIQERGKRLLKMISDIMDISRIDSDSLELVLRAVKIKELAREVVEEANEDLSQNFVQTVKLTYSSTLDDDVLVSGDKYRIKQILQAVIENAVKFTKRGTIDLRCWQEGNLVLFEVEDTGIGISEDKLPFVFDPFLQVFNNQEVDGGGAGLGLSLAKRLLKLMGTDISIESTLGKGTLVRFSLRLYDGGDLKSSFFNPKQNFNINWKDKTILVVEDEPSNQMYIKVILGKTGVNILMANDGVEAIELFEKNKEQIDLILMDVKMPRMNGYIATIKIKRIDPSVSIIALTANAMNNDREEAMSAGCDDYLTKPISREELFNTIEKYMRVKD